MYTRFWLRLRAQHHDYVLSQAVLYAIATKKVSLRQEGGGRLLFCPEYRPLQHLPLSGAKTLTTWKSTMKTLSGRKTGQSSPNNGKICSFGGHYGSAPTSVRCQLSGEQVLSHIELATA
jgi:hypothetical protein